MDGVAAFGGGRIDGGAVAENDGESRGIVTAVGMRGEPLND